MRNLPAGWAIVAAGILVALSIVGTRYISPYETTSGVGADGNPIVWRTNTITGVVEACGYVFTGVYGTSSRQAAVRCGSPTPVAANTTANCIPGNIFDQFDPDCAGKKP